MAHKFYCTNCASEVTTETVLFDMQELLTGDESQKLQILKFRMKEREIRELQRRGTVKRNDEYTCTLTFPELMGYICNPNNLNVPTAANLTMEEMIEFVEAMDSAGAQGSGAKDDDEDEELFNVLSMSETEAPAEEEPQAAKKEWPQAIRDLALKDTTYGSMEFSEGMLRDDLRIIRQLMLQGNSFCFDLKLLTRSDDRGNQILVGMTITNQDGKRSELINRVCPACGTKIFAEAGTAEHKAVVFIGDQESGKTSTILALTHYAMTHLEGDSGNQIWTGASTVRCIQEMKLLSPALELQKELANFSQGLGPKKTNIGARDDAYSATFLVKSRVGDKEVRKILTLTDLPGELCEWGGELVTSKILNEFAVALACDTFIVCFDTTTAQQAAAGLGGNNLVPDGKGNMVLRTPSMIINDTCNWADKFQTMLVQNTDKRTYVPTMLLFTKCQDLEKNTARAQTNTGAGMTLIQKTHMFCDELDAIKQNPQYKTACEKFANTAAMKKAFQAELRCSPYGYPAPAANMLQLQPELREKVQLPTPKNIDNLMRWVLMVSGCIPVEAKYQTSYGASGANNYYSLNNFYITRPQYRCENPQYNGEKPDEALARCYLFSNPGCHDKDFLGKYGNRAATIIAKTMTRADTNDK